MNKRITTVTTNEPCEKCQYNLYPEKYIYNETVLCYKCIPENAKPY